MAQARLASTLNAVFSQVLVPRIKGGRVAAVEVMLGTAAVKNLIRKGKPFLIPNTIRTSSNLGMKTLDDLLVDLFRKGLITRESVMVFCQDADDINKTLMTAGR
jgi:twitching motility protein PilT